MLQHLSCDSPLVWRCGQHSQFVYLHSTTFVGLAQGDSLLDWETHRSSLPEGLFNFLVDFAVSLAYLCIRISSAGASLRDKSCSCVAIEVILPSELGLIQLRSPLAGA